VFDPEGKTSNKGNNKATIRTNNVNMRTDHSQEGGFDEGPSSHHIFGRVFLFFFNIEKLYKVV